MRLLFSSLGLFLPLFAPAQTAVPKKAPQVASDPHAVPSFKDVAEEASLTVSHISTPEKKYIVESMIPGCTWARSLRWPKSRSGGRVAR